VFGCVCGFVCARGRGRGRARVGGKKEPMACMSLASVLLPPLCVCLRACVCE